MYLKSLCAKYGPPQQNYQLCVFKVEGGNERRRAGVCVSVGSLKIWRQQSVNSQQGGQPPNPKPKELQESAHSPYKENIVLALVEVLPSVIPHSMLLVCIIYGSFFRHPALVSTSFTGNFAWTQTVSHNRTPAVETHLLPEWQRSVWIVVFIVDFYSFNWKICIKTCVE